MRVVRLGTLFEHKYELVAQAIDPAHEEKLLRGYIGSIVKAYQNNPIVMLFATRDDLFKGRASGPEETKIKEGKKFCDDVHALIEKLYSLKDAGDIKEIAATAKALSDLILENASFVPSSVWGGDGKAAKFPAINSLIFSYFDSSRAQSRKERDGQYQKAGKIMETVQSLCVDILKAYATITGDKSFGVPEKFRGARAPLTLVDTVDFIRQYGSNYGIDTKDDWGLAIRDNPELKEKITTVINSLNRGHRPRDGVAVAKEIAPILMAHKMRHQKINQDAIESGSDMLQEQTRREMIKQKNDEIFENLKKYDPDPEFMAQQKQIQDDAEKRKLQREQEEKEITEDRERHVRSEGAALLKSLFKKRYL